MTTRLDDATIYVGHDIDGPHYDFVGALLADLAEQNPKEADRFRVENCHPSRDFFVGVGLDFDGFMAAYTDAMTRGVLCRPEFTHPGSVEAARRLHDELGDRIAQLLITDRSVGAPGAGGEQTTTWANAVKFPADGIVIDRVKTAFPTHFFIEDHAGNYQALRANGSECFLVRRFWNVDTPDIPTDHWVESVGEFVDIVAERVRRG